MFIFNCFHNLIAFTCSCANLDWDKLGHVIWFSSEIVRNILLTSGRFATYLIALNNFFVPVTMAGDRVVVNHCSGNGPNNMMLGHQTDDGAKEDKSLSISIIVLFDINIEWDFSYVCIVCIFVCVAVPPAVQSVEQWQLLVVTYIKHRNKTMTNT